MLRSLIILFTLFFISIKAYNQIGINQTDPDATLDIQASNTANPAITDGILIPRIDAFPSTNPGIEQNGLLVFLNTDNTFYFWHNITTSWIAINSDLVAMKIDDLSDARSDSDGSQDGSSIFIGKNAGVSDDLSDNKNIGIGFASLQLNLMGKSNVAFGYQALKSNTQSFNTGIGSFSLSKNTTGSNNTALGSGSLYNNIYGSFNIGIGKNALYYNSYGDFNIGIGYLSLNANTYGENNIAIGNNSFGSNTTGNRNTVIGDSAGGGLLTGNNNIIIGESVDADDPNGDHQLKIGSLISGNMANEHLSIEGTLQVKSNSQEAPPAGTIRWNADTNDFEGFTGSAWYSFTKSSWGSPIVNSYENSSILSSDGTSDHYFGQSVDVDGDYAVVGSPGIGKAYVFHRENNSWTQQSILTPSTIGPYDFGASVSISGDYIVVGQPSGFSGAAWPEQGAAYVYFRSGTSWNEQAFLTASSPYSTGNFGKSVDIDGEYIIVGAPKHDIAGNEDQGEAFIFHRTGTSWNEQAILFDSDGILLSNFGESVSIHNEYAAIGAHHHAEPGFSFAGAAFIFIRSGTSWTEQTKIIPSFYASYDEFGKSISLYNDYVIVGAPLQDVGSNINAGRAYIYKRTGTVWSEDAILTPSESSADDEFGTSVSISSANALVGAHMHDTSGNSDSGKCFMYNMPSSSWIEHSTLLASDGAADDHFGISLSIKGDYAFIGSHYHDTDGSSNQGKVYFFEK